MGEIHQFGEKPAKRGRKLTEREHQVMAAGRARSRLVDKYLRELATGKYHQSSGPRIADDPEAAQAALADLDAKLASNIDGVQRLFLLAERVRLEQAITGRGELEEFEKLEAKFIEIARDFSKARKIPYEAWRTMGVPSRVLIKAGIYPPNRGQSKTGEDESED